MSDLLDHAFTWRDGVIMSASGVVYFTFLALAALAKRGGS